MSGYILYTCILLSWLTNPFWTDTSNHGLPCSYLPTFPSIPYEHHIKPHYTGRPRKKLVSELLNSIKGALLCWMFKFSNALLCWMFGRWWLWRFWMTNFVLPKNGQKMQKCENVKFWIPSQWHSDCVQNFWGRPKSKIGRPVPFWKFQILGCWWWRELLSRVG